MRTTMMAMVLWILAGAAVAAEVGGVKLDDTATVGGAPVVLNGAGIRTRAVFKVYVASLYVPAKATDLNAVLSKAPRRIQFTDSLPKTASGKVLKRVLRERAREERT